MDEIHSMKGVGGVLVTYSDKVTITPTGVLGFLSKGMKGTKTIPFSSITAIQFKRASLLVNGYLQFTIHGGIESRGGVWDATSDENTLVFNDKAQNELANAIKEHVEKGMQQAKPQSASSERASLSTELEKLANLRAQGILSESEFQAAKMKLIST